MAGGLKLRRHQKLNLDFFRTKTRAVTLLPYGSGKTPILVRRIVDLCPPKRALIVTTNGTVYKWTRELLKWGDPGWRVVNLTGKKSKRLAAFDTPHEVAVINYEGLRVMLKARGKRFATHYPVKIFDEVHRVKGADTQISLDAAYVAHTNHTDYCYCATGSPVLESGLDLFGVFRVIRPELFGQNFDRWRKTFFQRTRREGDNFPRWYYKRGAEGFLRSKLHEIAFSMQDEDLDMTKPRQRFGDPFICQLRGKALKTYKGLEDELLLTLKHTRIPLEDVYARLEKLLQLARGWVYVREGVAKKIAEPGILALSQYLESIRGQGRPVIWAVRDPDFKMISECLEFHGINYKIISGGTRSMKMRDQVLRSFNAGNFDALIAHPRCVGEGEDMEAEYSFRYSYRWSHLEWDQPIGRFARMTSKAREVHYTDLICEGTVDEGVIEAIAKKKELGRRIKEMRTLPWRRRVMGGKNA